MKVISRYSVAASLGLLPLLSISQNSGENRPNIVFILADDLGYTDLSCMGSKYYETPYIDQIARSGMVFTNGYAACQVCSPSRASILTGKFPARHGITDWIGEDSGDAWRKMNRHTKLLPADYVRNLPKEYVTLPEALKQVGYKTFFAGKWHLGSKGSWPEDHGFDINKVGWDAGSPKGGYFSPYENPNLSDGPTGENLEMRLANETVKFMKENKDKPFLAYLSFYAVHGPIQTTQGKWKKYREKAEKMGISENGFAMERRLPYRLHQDNPVYAGLVESMDDAVGVVLKALKELGLDKNTIVIFTGDNGGVTSGDSFSTNNAPLRGGKGYQWEGGIREPYFISVPWMKIAGKKCDVPVSGTDFYPTILDLAKLPLRPDQHNDGVSLLPLLKGEKIADRALIWHYPHYGNQGGDPSSIIRRGDWKLIHYYEDGQEELYNLKTDLSETTDVSAKNPKLVSQLSGELFDYLHKVGAKFPVKDPQYNADLGKEYQDKIQTVQWPKLENQRKQMFKKDFDPKNDCLRKQNGNGAEFSNYIVADAYFSKRPFVEAVLSTGMHFISRLRDDSVLNYKYTGAPTGRKGATDLEQAGEKIVRYYQSRFQIEFLYRDAKQFTGLTNCQARGINKLDFHLNATLTAINPAKQDWLTAKGKGDKPFSMSNYKTLYNNTLMLERFMYMFAINPNTPKIKKFSKNY